MKPVICFKCQQDISTHARWFFFAKNIYCANHAPKGSKVFAMAGAS